MRKVLHGHKPEICKSEEFLMDNIFSEVKQYNDTDSERRIWNLAKYL